jgi:hypothetical protein
MLCDVLFHNNDSRRPVHYKVSFCRPLLGKAYGLLSGKITFNTSSPNVVVGDPVRLILPGVSVKRKTFAVKLYPNVLDNFPALDSRFRGYDVDEDLFVKNNQFR